MDYNSKVSLICPVCRGSSFSGTDSMFLCVVCNKTYTRQQLEKANEGRIQKEINNIVEKKILPDVAKQMKTSLQKAFKGNPYIKIK
jgi:transposase-like protein